MAILSFELREYFHLSFLYHLSMRLAGRPYALKGGVCLRFFHRSPRLSEDMDLDVSSNIRQQTLENVVDSIIKTRSFLNPLMAKGVKDIAARKPKQTETTQRWKFTLNFDQIALPTKIEFSRRRSAVSSSSGVPDPELLTHYNLHPFAACYYDATNICGQKILALASPARNALRDLYDLDLLLSSRRVDLKSIKKSIAADSIENAAVKAEIFRHQDFKEQVLPFLSESLMSLYANRAAFDGLKERLENTFLELMS